MIISVDVVGLLLLYVSCVSVNVVMLEMFALLSTFLPVVFATFPALTDWGVVLCMEDVNVRVGDTDITSVNSVKKMGVIFDSAMNMEQRVNRVCRSGYYQLRNIGHTRRYLTDDATQSLVKGLVASRLDYCNVLLSGLHHTSINKLQSVQNTAARIVIRTSRYSHITPVLINLHYLLTIVSNSKSLCTHIKSYMDMLQDICRTC